MWIMPDNVPPERESASGRLGQMEIEKVLRLPNIMGMDGFRSLGAVDHLGDGRDSAPRAEAASAPQARLRLLLVLRLV